MQTALRLRHDDSVHLQKPIKREYYASTQELNYTEYEKKEISIKAKFYTGKEQETEIVIFSYRVIIPENDRLAKGKWNKKW